jgi:hypothetical protein
MIWNIGEPTDRRFSGFAVYARSSLTRRVGRMRNPVEMALMAQLREVQA